LVAIIFDIIFISSSVNQSAKEITAFLKLATSAEVTFHIYATISSVIVVPPF
jgi:hypothetical protein